TTVLTSPQKNQDYYWSQHTILTLLLDKIEFSGPLIQSVNDRLNAILQGKAAYRYPEKSERTIEQAYLAQEVDPEQRKSLRIYIKATDGPAINLFDFHPKMIKGHFYVLFCSPNHGREKHNKKFRIVKLSKAQHDASTPTD